MGSSIVPPASPWISDGIIYVADWLNNRLQVFDAEGSFVTTRTGEATVSKWGKEKLDANAEMWGERRARLRAGTGKGFLGTNRCDGR